jgi:hypothetical protein
MTEFVPGRLLPHVCTAERVIGEPCVDVRGNGTLRLERKRLLQRRTETLSVIPKRVHTGNLLQDLNLAFGLRLEVKRPTEQREGLIDLEPPSRKFGRAAQPRDGLCLQLCMTIRLVTPERSTSVGRTASA